MHHPLSRYTRSSLLWLCLIALPACDSCGSDVPPTPSFGSTPTTGFAGGSNVTGGSTFVTVGGIIPFPDGGRILDGGLPDVPVWEPRPANSGGPVAGGEFANVGVFPEQGAVDVPRDTTFEVNFSRELQLRTPPVVEVVELDASLPSSVDVHVEGTKLIATLAEGQLEPGKRYRVRVFGQVFAVSGEAFLVSNLEWTFTTEELENALSLAGPLDAVAYDPVGERLWGFDREARTLAQIDLVERVEAPRMDLLYIPSDLCVSPDGQAVYLVNQGSSFITEVAADGGQVLREIPWPAPVEVVTSLPYHIRCTEGRLLVVDGAERPGLWSVDLTQDPPVVTDHSTTLSDVGDVVSSADGSLVYAWWRVPAEEGEDQLAVGQLDPATFEPVQQTVLGPWQGGPGAPILLDPAGARVVTHTRVLDGSDLSIVRFSFDATVWTVDFARERAVTTDEVFSLRNYRGQATPLVSQAAHRFFDQEGRLHFVVHDPTPQLVTQTFEPDPDPVEDEESEQGEADPDPDPDPVEDEASEEAEPDDSTDPVTDDPV